MLDLQLEKYGISFDIKKYTTSGWALGDENVIGIRSFKGLGYKNGLKKTESILDLSHLQAKSGQLSML